MLVLNEGLSLALGHNDKGGVVESESEKWNALSHPEWQWHARRESAPPSSELPLHHIVYDRHRRLLLLQ